MMFAKDSYVLIFVCLQWMISLVEPASGDDFVRLRGQFISLTTDLPESEELSELIASFDAAVPQWEKSWGLPAGQLSDWRLEAFLMKDDRRFYQAGLIDQRVPNFPFGWVIGNKAWIRVQPSAYYTRHLVLHEGVHSAAFDQFGDGGPTWFREGTAEWLATHAGVGSTIRVGIVPHDRQAVPYWGRFKRMQQVRSARKLPSLRDVMSYSPDLRGDPEAYGWSWALVSMLNAYPEYQPTLLAAARHGRDSDQAFNQWIDGQLSSSWPVVSARWRNLMEDFDYGFDWAVERINLSRTDPSWDGEPININVSAGRGWQSIGVQIDRPTTLEVQAVGEVLLDTDPKDWISHPSGVTIDYYNGRPLGQLMARVVPVDPQFPVQTVSVGPSRVMTIDRRGWLLLKVNDAPGRRADNRGSYQVRVLPKR